MCWGKFLYFSLANVLVDKAEFSELCEDILGTPYTGGNRVTVSDAFRSATGDIRERLCVRDGSEQTIYEMSLSEISIGGQKYTFLKIIMHKRFWC